MSKYCMQCGKEINDTDMHCQYCGASQENNFGSSANAETVKHKTDILVPVVAVISIILVIVIVVVNLTVLNNGYKKPIDSYFTAIEKGDADYIEDALPDYITDSDDYDKEKLEKSFEPMMKELSDDMEISYDVLDKTPVDDDDLDKLEESIEKKYDESVDVEQGYKVKMEVTIEYKGETATKKATVTVYEIEGKWCMTEDSLKSFTLL